MASAVQLAAHTLPIPSLWSDRAGRFSWIRLVASALVFGPALWIVFLAFTGGLGAKPVTEAIHRTGDWTVRLLLISLAITPLRRITRLSKLITARRMIGLGALGYALGHITLFAGDQGWDLGKVVSEIALRFYLTIGFVALIGLVALGVTSTDRWIRKLGPDWRRLHQASYAIGVLALAHFFLQSKIDVSQPVWMSGVFLLLMGCRLAQTRGFSLESPWTLGALAVLAAVLTALLETAWYGLATGVAPLRVLQANLSFGYAISPAWTVLAIGLAPTLYLTVKSARALWSPRAA